MSENATTIQELEVKFVSSTAQIKADMNGLTNEIKEMQKTVETLNSKGTVSLLFGDIKSKLAGISFAYFGKQMASVGKSAVEMAMDVVESESLFETSLGNMAEKAREWSDEVSEALGLNAYDVRNNVGVLYNMTTSMGLADDTAYDLSTTLTGLAYDMASFYNLDDATAFTKLRAGITGETEPLKALGILVDENTVKQAAYKHSVAQAGEELTQQQKVIGRYYAILDQTSNAQGDLARTMDSPANQIRRLKNEYNQAAIALGQALLPVVKEVVPYMAALAQITAEAISGLSGITGTTVELSTASSNINSSNVVSELTDISEEAKDAEYALKGATTGLDELNILSSSTDASDMDFSGDYSFDLSASGYDLLGDLQSQTSEAYETMKGWLDKIEPIAKRIGEALLLYGGFKVINGITTLSTNLGKLKTSFGNAAGANGASGLTDALIGSSGVVFAAKSSYDMFYDLRTGTLDLNTALIDIAGMGGGIALAGTALGPTGVLAAGVGALLTGLIGNHAASEQLKRDFIDAQFFKDRAVTVQDLADATESAWKYMNDYADKQEEYREEISETSTTIRTTKETIDELVERSKTASNDEYPQIIELISEEFEELCDAAKTSLTANENSVCAFFDDVVAKADTDTRIAIEGLKEDFISLQTLLGNEVAAEEANVRALLAKTKGGTVRLSAEDQQSLQDSFNRITNLTATSSKTAEVGVFENLTKDLEGLQFGKNQEDAEQALRHYIDVYDKARESIELIYGNVNTQIETFEQKFQDEKLRAAAKSAGIDVDATIQKMKAAAESGRKNDIANLQADMEKTYKLLEQAYAQNVEESIAEYVKSHSKTGTSILGVSTATTPKAVLESEAQAIVDEKYAEIRALMSQMNGLAGYATGGTPRKAQLFYAREDGIPELVGRMGTQTAVANNYQIEQGISDAVYRAMVSANGGSGGNNQPLIIQVIDDTGNIKAEQYISAAERKNLRDGKVTIPLGV